VWQVEGWQNDWKNHRQKMGSEDGVGLFFSEITMCIERKTARRLRREILELSRDQHDKLKDWNDLHLSYFAVMGGFQIVEEEDPGQPKTEDTAEQIRNKMDILTPYGVLFPARKGTLPKITADYVRDKSKLNAISRVLVCFQAGWMMLQVLARTISGLSVTPLELHVVMHTLYSLVMYSM
jgi:hypothetical protein